MKITGPQLGISLSSPPFLDKSDIPFQINANHFTRFSTIFARYNDLLQATQIVRSIAKTAHAQRTASKTTTRQQNIGLEPPTFRTKALGITPAPPPPTPFTWTSILARLSLVQSATK